MVLLSLRLPSMHSEQLLSLSTTLVSWETKGGLLRMIRCSLFIRSIQFQGHVGQGMGPNCRSTSKGCIFLHKSSMASVPQTEIWTCHQYLQCCRFIRCVILCLLPSVIDALMNDRQLWTSKLQCCQDGSCCIHYDSCTWRGKIQYKVICHRPSTFFCDFSMSYKCRRLVPDGCRWLRPQWLRLSCLRTCWLIWVYVRWLFCHGSSFNTPISLHMLLRLLQLFVTQMDLMLLVKSLRSGLVLLLKYDGKPVMVPSLKLTLPSLLLLWVQLYVKDDYEVNRANR